ncbi:MAG: potassium:proton antiporter [Pseudodesulfovibrio sp.]
MFKTLGILFWAGCLLTLAFQAATWVFTAAWPSVTLLDAVTRLGIDVTDFFDTVPTEVLLKAAYVLLTTQLSMGLWWAGTACFALAMALHILFRK